jgi:DNA-binding CsgD family transcriptional regulator/PAS domain-containing protein
MIDAEIVSSLISMIYDAALDPDGWPGVLEWISDLIGGGPTGLLAGGPAIGGLPNLMVRLREDAAAEYARYYGGLDFMRRAAEHAPAGTLVLDQEVLSREAQDRTDFCNGWVRPNDIGGCAQAVLHRGPGWTALLSATHRRKVDAFTPEQHRLLSLLLPHLRQAVLTCARLHAAETERDAVGGALDALADPVLLVDGAGRLVRANKAAERLLANTDGLGVGRGGELRAATPAQTRALDRLLAGATRLDGVRVGGTLSLERPSLGTPLRLLAMPLPTVSTRPGFPSEARAILIVVDPDEPRTLPSARLQALFGLTPAEAEVAVALAAGEGLPAVAERLGIARPTARTHADRILAKTGTGRQAELARLLERLAVLA